MKICGSIEIDRRNKISSTGCAKLCATCKTIITQTNLRGARVPIGHRQCARQFAPASRKFANKKSSCDSWIGNTTNRTIKFVGSEKVCADNKVNCIR